MLFSEAIDLLSQYDDATPIYVEHPETHEVISYGYCSTQGYTGASTKIVIERSQDDAAFTVGQFMDMVDGMRAEQQDHELLIDFAEDHDPRDDVYYHVSSIYYQEADGWGYLVIVPAESESEREFKTAARFREDASFLTVNNLLFKLEEWPDSVEIVVNHPDSKELMRFSYAYSVAFEDNTVASTCEVEEGGNAFTAGAFRAMTRDYRDDQLDDYFVIDLEDDHDPEYDWYYHVIDTDIASDDREHTLFVLYLGEPEAATAYVERVFDNDAGVGRDKTPGINTLPVSGGFGSSSSSSSSGGAKKQERSAQMGLGVDIASGTPGLGIKIGGGSRVGFGYNVAAKKGGLQVWV